MNTEKQTAKRDLILFLGQSNMQGETERLTETEAVEGVSEYRFLTDSLVPLQNPVGENIGHDMKPGYRYVYGGDQNQWLRDNVLAGVCFGYTNMVPEFMRAYRKKTGRDAVVVFAPRGSTTVGYWLPGTEGYRAVIEKTKAAIAFLGSETIGERYAVWLQGESDAVYGATRESYRKDLHTLVNALEEELSLTAFTVIKVGYFASLARWVQSPHEEALAHDEAIREAQEDVCRENPTCRMLTRIAGDLLLKGDPYLNPEVDGHFGATGLEVLGRIAGNNLGAIALGGEIEDPDPSSL